MDWIYTNQLAGCYTASGETGVPLQTLNYKSDPLLIKTCIVRRYGPIVF